MSPAPWICPLIVRVTVIPKNRGPVAIHLHVFLVHAVGGIGVCFMENQGCP